MLLLFRILSTDKIRMERCDMGAEGWIITGGILVAAGTGLFVFVQIYTGSWLRKHVNKHD